MDILKTVNKISQILSEKNINYIYLCGGTGRKFLAVGIDALDNSLTLGESITDIDILAETDKENIDADTLNSLTQETAETLSNILDVEHNAIMARSKFQKTMGRIAISLPTDHHHKIDLDLKIFAEPEGLSKNRPTTLMRRKIDISNSLNEESLHNLATLSLDELIQSKALLVDNYDKPIRNYVALCDDKQDYLITSEKRSYFLRRVCYDMAICGVALPKQDMQWAAQEFFPALYRDKPTKMDADYGLETLLRISKGLDHKPAISLLQENNYLGWLLNMPIKEQATLFKDIVAV